ncbi:hypothetical protein GCM10009555_043380 [Acrocarpospora macrocephala]|uniref:Uncharacterized protein n=2 Tax=Acrocarpospora macrocephala TaxID=150177 RepID=A0A5M3WF93_9ACTN|nr:hypothetical protein Amac_005940 [Acrocarpospora macrocephala]
MYKRGTRKKSPTRKSDDDRDNRDDRDERDDREKGGSSDESSSEGDRTTPPLTKTKGKRTLEKVAKGVAPRSPVRERGVGEERIDPPKRARNVGEFTGTQTNVGGEPAQALPPARALRKTAVLCKDGDLVALDQADSEDSVVQVLRYLLTNPMFAGLLDGVAAKAAKAEDVQALVEAQGELEPSMKRLNELMAITQGLGAGAHVVVIDSRDDDSLRADHDPYENMIRIGEIQNTEPGWHQDTADYWPCLVRVLFELCNAARADINRNLMREAREGDLGCVSFVLSMELNEDRTNVEFDRLWGSIMAAGPHQVRKGGRTVTSDVPDLRLINVTGLSAEVAAQLRWRAQLMGGHVADYVEMWFGNFGAIFKGKNPEDWQDLLNVIDPPPDSSDEGEGPDNESDDESDGMDAEDRQEIVEDVQHLVGVQVPPLHIVDVVKVMRAWYKLKSSKV